MDVRNNKVMVFGVFDGLHDNHHYFLSEAGKYGDYLIVVVAPDSEVKLLKNKSPRFSLSDRIEKIKNSETAQLVVAGDDEHGSWNIIKTHEPSIVALGYDQQALEEALKIYIGKHSLEIELKRVSKLL